MLSERTSPAAERNQQRQTFQSLSNVHVLDPSVSSLLVVFEKERKFCSLKEKSHASTPANPVQIRENVASRFRRSDQSVATEIARVRCEARRRLHFDFLVVPTQRRRLLHAVLDVDESRRRRREFSSRSLRFRRVVNDANEQRRERVEIHRSGRRRPGRFHGHHRQHQRRFPFGYGIRLINDHQHAQRWCAKVSGATPKNLFFFVFVHSHRMGKEVCSRMFCQIDVDLPIVLFPPPGLARPKLFFFLSLSSICLCK